MVEESIKMKEEVESTCNVGKLFSRTANMELPLEIPEFGFSIFPHKITPTNAYQFGGILSQIFYNKYVEIEKKRPLIKLYHNPNNPPNFSNGSKLVSALEKLEDTPYTSFTAQILKIMMVKYYEYLRPYHIQWRFLDKIPEYKRFLEECCEEIFELIEKLHLPILCYMLFRDNNTLVYRSTHLLFTKELLSILGMDQEVLEQIIKDRNPFEFYYYEDMSRIYEQVLHLVYYRKQSCSLRQRIVKIDGRVLWSTQHFLTFGIKLSHHVFNGSFQYFISLFTDIFYTDNTIESPYTKYINCPSDSESHVLYNDKRIFEKTNNMLKNLMQSQNLRHFELLQKYTSYGLQFNMIYKPKQHFEFLKLYREQNSGHDLFIEKFYPWIYKEKVEGEGSLVRRIRRSKGGKKGEIQKEKEKNIKCSKNKNSQPTRKRRKLKEDQ